MLLCHDDEDEDSDNGILCTDDKKMVRFHDSCSDNDQSLNSVSHFLN
jgi:hypothetical protein